MSPSEKSAHLRHESVNPYANLLHCTSEIQGHFAYHHDTLSAQFLSLIIDNLVVRLGFVSQDSVRHRL